jgi:hypothetical protein
LGKTEGGKNASDQLTFNREQPGLFKVNLNRASRRLIRTNQKTTKIRLLLSRPALLAVFHRQTALLAVFLRQTAETAGPASEALKDQGPEKAAGQRREKSCSEKRKIMSF